MVLNAFFLGSLKRLTSDPSLQSWVDDGGVLASAAALLGIVVLLAGIAEVVIGEARAGNTRMNELVILAVLASIAWANFQQEGAVALVTAGGIAFFMLVTLVIESQSAVGAHSSLEALAQLAPGKARRVLPDGAEELVDPNALRPGDLLQVRPGENVYADGEIRQGTTSLQEANITGEALPVDKSAGDAVYAGTVNLSGLIEMAVQRAGKDSTLGKVRELIAQAQSSRLPFTRLIDHYVRYYTPVIVMVAVIVWLATYDLTRIAALLVAACPIALILATPSAMIAALSAAARLGVLIKNVSDIESMARIDGFVLDKTGTLTTGELGVARLAPVEGVKPAELVRIAASAEQRSNHPVAVAIHKLAEKVRVPLTAPNELHEEPGRGIRASVDGDSVIVGNLGWMLDNGLSEKDFPAGDEAGMEGVSLLYVMRNQHPLGWIALEDQLRPGAAEALEELRGLNVAHLALVTGDRESVAERVAAELGIADWRGACIPADKVRYVEEVKRRGVRTAFVGDGVNDGPALAASQIGIAMGAAGSDVAVESATIALLNNRLDRLPFLLRLARRARLVVLGNLIVGGVFIFGGVGLSAAGILSPLAAAVIQVVSSLAVVMNSARLVREGEELR